MKDNIRRDAGLFMTNTKNKLDKIPVKVLHFVVLYDTKNIISVINSVMSLSCLWYAPKCVHKLPCAMLLYFH